MSRPPATLLLLLCLGGPATGHACVDSPDPEPGRVQFVYDGDTVRLEDGRRLRLIGINAPETAHHERPGQALAEASRDHLRDLLATSNRVRIVIGADRRDRYGRQLVHLQLANGADAAAELLRQGLAQAITIPPNLEGLDCYREMEQKARAEGLGMWQLQRYQPIPVQQLRGDERGFYLVRGTVQRIGKSRNNLWLDLAKDFSLRIRRSDLVYFDAPAVETWQGRQVEARGWITARKGQQRIKLRHPANLLLLH